VSRRIAALVLVVCSCGLAGCGGGSKSGDPGATVRGYIEAVADGHAKQICAYLTGAARSERGGADCVAKVRRATAGMSPQEAATIRQLKSKVVSVHDSSAEVRLFVPQAACEAGKVQRIDLVKKNGAWLISRTDDRACAPGA
jgi:hypothetical protein